ncbi:MAG TPA: hypothetical protein VES89_08315 [Candidatus Competibacteraceae bacterium]|nr:hypothetical protein [Candidatus Competibacteraceae bacterium]
MHSFFHRFTRSGLLLAGLLTAAAGATQPGAIAPQVETFQGIARNDQGAIVYLETHQLVYENGRLRRNQTRYLDPKGVEFAALVSDFASNPYVPNYRFSDRRFGREDGARLSRNEIQVYGQESGDAPRREAIVALGPNTITGQGLHAFIRDHLEELARGEVKKVDFLVPLDETSYSLRIAKAPLPAKPGVLVLRIESDNWLARLVVPRLEVEYELATKRLLSYKGMSNLLNQDRDLQNVVITYRYDNSS